VGLCEFVALVNGQVAVSAEDGTLIHADAVRRRVLKENSGTYTGSISGEGDTSKDCICRRTVLELPSNLGPWGSTVPLTSQHLRHEGQYLAGGGGGGIHPKIA